MPHMKFYKIFENNTVASKDLKLQNANWSYVPFHIMPMTPFNWIRHILLKPLSIWTIFVALNAHSKELQNGFWISKATEQCTKIYKFLFLNYKHVYPSSYN